MDTLYCGPTLCLLRRAPDTRVRISRHLPSSVIDQTEVLLVNRRGDDDLALHIADNAAREHVRTAHRIVIVDGVYLLATAKHRDLSVVDQGAHTGLGKNILE